MPIRNLLLPTLALLLASCQPSAQPAAPAEALPKLNDLRPAAQPVTPGPADQPVGGPAPVLAHLLRLEFPAGADLERAWAAAHHVGTEPPAAALWQANGMRCVLVDAADLKAVLDALPPVMGHQNSRITAGDQFVPLSPGRSVTAPITLHLTLVPGQETEEKFDSGRFQFLAHFGAMGPGAVVELTPHLYIRRLTLLPRSPEQMQLDGRQFDPLALRIYLMPRQTLLIGVATDPAAMAPVLDLDQPASPLPSAPATQPALPPGASPPAPPRVIAPNRLGAALLTTGPTDHPRQVLLLLGLEPRRP
jgi:hypothetical protein